MENRERYGQTLVFAVNRMHALTLQELFKSHGIPAGVVMTGKQAEFIGIEVSNTENERNIADYRAGKIKVLINVNILTEGVDLPLTKTVFLARPTVSKILMTQMVGRALRGERAGGTRDAYVVTFIDNWQERIAWVNPETLLEDESDFSESSHEAHERNIRLVSIAKIEEFARMMDESVDTSLLERIPFEKRIPLGMYLLSFLDQNRMERNCQVLVYDSTKAQYERLIRDFPLLFEEYHLNEEIIPEETLDELCEIVSDSYFDEFMLPAYDQSDIRSLLKYYAQKSCEPAFVSFDEIDRKKLDAGAIAKEIIEKDMRPSEKRVFLNELWSSEDNLLRIFFNKKMYFLNQITIEMQKLDGELEFAADTENTVFEERDIIQLSLYEMAEFDPERAHALREHIFLKYRNEQGTYYCAECGYSSPLRALFQIDHIMPRSKGGCTIEENLQLLCRHCNQVKGDRV